MSRDRLSLIPGAQPAVRPTRSFLDDPAGPKKSVRSNSLALDSLPEGGKSHPWTVFPRRRDPRDRASAFPTQGPFRSGRARSANARFWAYASRPTTTALSADFATGPSEGFAGSPRRIWAIWASTPTTPWHLVVRPDAPLVGAEPVADHRCCGFAGRWPASSGREPPGSVFKAGPVDAGPRTGRPTLRWRDSGSALPSRASVCGRSGRGSGGGRRAGHGSRLRRSVRPRP